MATKTDHKKDIQDFPSKSSKRANEFDWEDFRPEWAAEGIERISSELEKWNERASKAAATSSARTARSESKRASSRSRTSSARSRA